MNLRLRTAGLLSAWLVAAHASQRGLLLLMFVWLLMEPRAADDVSPGTRRR